MKSIVFLGLTALLTVHFASQLTAAGVLDVFSKKSNNTSNHSATFGQKGPLDWILYVNHTQLAWKLMRSGSVEVDLPGKGQPPRGVITYIEAKDQMANGTGGHVYLKSGGVGQNHVTLLLKSQPNHGLDFVIYVYGHK